MDDMNKKECPSCALYVDKESEVCPFCGYEFPKESKWPKYAVIALATMLIVYFLIEFVIF